MPLDFVEVYPEALGPILKVTLGSHQNGFQHGIFVTCLLLNRSNSYALLQLHFLECSQPIGIRVQLVHDMIRTLLPC